MDCNWTFFSWPSSLTLMRVVIMVNIRKMRSCFLTRITIIFLGRMEKDWCSELYKKRNKHINSTYTFHSTPHLRNVQLFSFLSVVWRPEYTKIVKDTNNIVSDVDIHICFFGPLRFFLFSIIAELSDSSVHISALLTDLTSRPLCLTSQQCAQGKIHNHGRVAQFAIVVVVPGSSPLMGSSWRASILHRVAARLLWTVMQER